MTELRAGFARAVQETLYSRQTWWDLPSAEFQGSPDLRPLDESQLPEAWKAACPVIEKQLRAVEREEFLAKQLKLSVERIGLLIEPQPGQVSNL
jgi:hypothetical protein